MHVKNKIIIGLAIGAAIGLGSATAAVAAPTEVLGHGTQAGGVEIDGEQTGSTGDAARTAGSGDGSFWQWGVGRDDTFSNYFREKSCHGSTAVGKKTKRVTDVRGGVYSRASTPKATSGNKAYHHNC